MCCRYILASDKLNRFLATSKFKGVSKFAYKFANIFIHYCLMTLCNVYITTNLPSDALATHNFFDEHSVVPIHSQCKIYFKAQVSFSLIDTVLFPH